jgi:Putative outer membrane beta-barrel porin, MtrB/PioB
MRPRARVSINEYQVASMTSNNAKRLAGIGPALLLIPAIAWADSGVGVDTWRANKLDPTGGMASQQCDEDGTTWLSPLEHRSPTGNLYDCPPESPLALALGDWAYYGDLELGYVHAGDDRYALWNRYTDWRENQPIGSLDLHFERPSDGSYAVVRGSRINDDDQYYQAVYGQAGAYKVQAFMRDMPNILSTDAKPVWNGVGSNALTLPRSLTPGESTSAEVAAVSAATPTQTLQVNRKKEGLNLSAFLTPHWTGYLDVTHERREGERPYGGPFGEDWPPNVGAILETVKPIDDSTINLNTGLRYAGAIWRSDFGYSGSYYRDQYLSYSFQQPFFILSEVPAGAIAPPVAQGQMSMEPNNNYHNLHGSLTHVTPMNGEFSLNLSEVLMTQRSSLIPPTNCQGYLGWGTPSSGSTQLSPQNVGPQNPNLIPCSQWNTTAALSQSNADVNMHNTLAQMTLALRPRNDLTVNTGFKYYRQNYYNDYLAYNPSNGYYGYIGENGVYLHTYGLPLAFLNGTFPSNAVIIDDRVRPYLLSMDDYNAYGGLTWRASERDSLGFIYTFDEYRPTSRERDRVDDDSIKLTWVDKSLGWVTFRANYTFLRQTGSVYDTDVYGYAFLAALPGFAQAYPDFVVGPSTVDQLRKFDISNRTENKVDLMSTFAPRQDLTVSASFRGDWNSYPVLIGRQGYNTLAAQIAAEWTPTPTDSASAYIGYDHSALALASVAGAPGNTPTCGELGCPFYPLASRWWESDNERNYSAGATLRHRIDRATFDLNWSYIYARGLLDYTAASPSALVYPSEFATMGSGFPANTYRVNSVTVGATVQFTERVALRVFDTYEIGNIADWHYAGFNQGLVSGNTLYTDGGPQSYSENLVGVMVNVKL